jgi:hypothetical protein
MLCGYHIFYGLVFVLLRSITLDTTTGLVISCRPSASSKSVSKSHVGSIPFIVSIASFSEFGPASVHHLAPSIARQSLIHTLTPFAFPITDNFTLPCTFPVSAHALLFSFSTDSTSQDTQCLRPLTSIHRHRRFSEISFAVLSPDSPRKPISYLVAKTRVSGPCLMVFSRSKRRLHLLPRLHRPPDQAARRFSRQRTTHRPRPVTWYSDALVRLPAICRPPLCLYKPPITPPPSLFLPTRSLSINSSLQTSELWLLSSQSVLPFLPFTSTLVNTFRPWPLLMMYDIIHQHQHYFTRLSTV